MKGPSPWILLAFSSQFANIPQKISNLSEGPGNLELSLELIVLMSQPQPSWSLLLKVRPNVLNIFTDKIFYLLKGEKFIHNKFSRNFYLRQTKQKQILIF